jgi:hypothetical protein
LTKNHHKPAEEIASLEETIFEPGDKVRVRATATIGERQHVPQGEIGIISSTVHVLVLNTKQYAHSISART